MKTTLTVLALALSLFATSSFAKTELKNTKITNSSKNDKTLALGIKGGKASVGSVNIKNLKASKSTITNSSKNSKSLALAIGKGSEADVGSINIK